MKILPATLVALVMLCSCTGGKKPPEAVSGEELTRYASFLRISRQDNATVARVLNPQDTIQLLGTYIFPDTDTTTVSTPDGAIVLRPSDLQRLMVYSGVHGSALKELGALDAIKIVGDADYFTVPEVQERLRTGAVKDGGTQQAPIKERIIETAPKALVVSWYPGMDASAIERLGVPVVYMLESQEQTPLGRAEWMRFMGLLAGSEAAADSIFNSVSRDYLALTSRSSNLTPKPKVLTETMYEGVWNVAGGNSYAARMIADAGGQYLWSDNESTGSLQLPFESVLAKGADADVWLIRLFGNTLTTDYLRAADERYMLFAPAANGGKGLWGCNTQAVPFYEETPFHPDRLLRDYIAIFHPGVLPDYKPRYFSPAAQ